MKSIVCILIFTYGSARAQLFVKGSVIMKDGDTLVCSILKIKNKRQDEKSSFKEIQLKDSLGDTKTLYPKDVIAYTRGDIVYRSIRFNGSDIFIKSMVTGKAVLYCHEGDDPNQDVYFFKREGEKIFNVMNYDAQFRKIDRFNSDLSGSGKGTFTLIVDKSKSFISFFTEYFKDCEAVSRKIKIEFYTSVDMVDIFKDYNKLCTAEPLR